MSKKTCFIVTAIGNEGSPTRENADSVLKNIIKPVLTELNYAYTRVDNESVSGNITESIINHLRNDDLVIADLTGHNPNAFYELGYRQALELPLIQIIQESETLPFDVNQQRSIFYNMHVDKVGQARNALHDMVIALEPFMRSSIENDAKNDLTTKFDALDTKLDKILNEISNLNKQQLSALDLEKFVKDIKESSTPRFSADHYQRPSINLENPSFRLPDPSNKQI